MTEPEAKSWLERRAPGLHRFLVRDDRPWPLVREVGALLLLVLLLVGVLWGGTGQAIGDRPVVVVESGSMMHCENGFQSEPRNCQSSRFGRFGTIDPGDLIFVRDIDGPEDVTTAAEGGRSRYGHSGDVIIFRPAGKTGETPIIHRALFWLEVESGGQDARFSIPDLGITHATVRELESNTRVRELVGSGTNFSYIAEGCNGPQDSGFITRGDNNGAIDETSTSFGCAIKPEWILGKSRGEVPWIGLVNLKFNDMLSRGVSHNYAAAPDDVKTMMWVTILLVVGGPIAVDLAFKRRRGSEGDGAQEVGAQSAVGDRAEQPEDGRSR